MQSQIISHAFRISLILQILPPHADFQILPAPLWSERTESLSLSVYLSWQYRERGKLNTSAVFCRSISGVLDAVGICLVRSDRPSWRARCPISCGGPRAYRDPLRISKKSNRRRIQLARSEHFRILHTMGVGEL